jgi:hydrogenase/urease accessory protein HupE
VILISGVALAIAWPTAAHAHLVQSGLGPFYDGIAHFALSPDDWLFAVALALLGGLSGARAGRAVLFALPAAWAMGGVLGLGRETVADWPAASAATLIVAGALVAWSPRLPAPVLGALSVVAGGLHGYLNGSLAAAAGLRLSGVAGVAATVFVVAALAAALVVSLRRQWMRIAVRVAGSWIAAIGLLLLGWSLRAGQ